MTPSLIAPTRLLRLVEEQTEDESVELSHEVFSLRLLEETHVVGQSLGDDVALSLVARRSGAVDVASRLCKLGVVPELAAGAPVLLDAKVPETSDVLSAISYILT